MWEGENRSVVGVVGVRGGRCFKAFKKVDLSGTTDFYFDSEWSYCNEKFSRV